MGLGWTETNIKAECRLGNGIPGLDFMSVSGILLNASNDFYGTSLCRNMTVS